LICFRRKIHRNRKIAMNHYRHTRVYRLRKECAQMTIDHQIETARSLLNAEIIKNNYSLTAGAVLCISQKLDALLISRHKQMVAEGNTGIGDYPRSIFKER
jgi:hypothetical protein